MCMGKVRTLYITIFLLFCMSTLFAQILVKYQPVNSLVFEIGSTPLFPDRNMIAHIGTMTFSSSDNSALFDPTFMQVSHVSNGITFSGERYSHTENGIAKYNPGSFGFRIVAVTTFTGGEFTKKDITSSPGTPMIPNSSGNQLGKIIDIKLYLVSWESNMNAIAKLGSSYMLTSNNLENFNIAIAKSGSGFYNGYNYAKINRQPVPGSPPEPFFETPITSIPYGSGPPEEVFQLFIEDEQQFTITEAYGGGSTTIAKARIAIANKQQNTPYGITIMFSNRQGSPQFNLHLDNNLGLYSIPYTLLFNGEEVQNDKPISWLNIVEAESSKDIKITKVDGAKADMAPAGNYFDTIKVTITPIDT